MKLDKSPKKSSVKSAIVSIAMIAWILVPALICERIEIYMALCLKKPFEPSIAYLIILLAPFLIMGLIRYMKMEYKPSVLGVIFKAIGIVVFSFFVAGCVSGVRTLTDDFSLIGCIVVIIMLALFYGISMGLFVLAEYFENRKRQTYDPHELENLLKK